MAKTDVEDWSTNPALNTDIAGIDIAENCLPGGINDAIRNIMAQFAAWLADPAFTVNRRITFDNGDYLQYDPTANSYNFFIAGGSPIQITAAGIVVGPGNSITRNGGGKYLRAADGAIPGDAWSRGTAPPSGGSDGDFYYQDLTGSGVGKLRVWHNFGGVWKGTA